jgi:hypothetical protein
MYIAMSAFLRIAPASSSSHGDPDAGGGHDLPSVDHERVLQGGSYAPRRPDCLAGVGYVLQQHRELVAAQPARGVPAAAAAANALGHLHEQLVTRGVAEAVVDRLEVVEVEEQDGVTLGTTAFALQRALGPVLEQRAVRELGEPVVQGLMGQLVLQLLALGRVTAREHDRVDEGIAAQVVRDVLDLPPRAVGVPHPPLDGRGHP